MISIMTTTALRKMILTVAGTDEPGDSDPINVASFRHVTGSDHNDSITGDYRMNVLNGMGGNDTIRAGDSWDMLIGGPGEDALYGGESGGVEDDEDTVDDETMAEDVDWAVYRGAKSDVTVDLQIRGWVRRWRCHGR